ncbi:hypothetical protein ALNOE001_10500 [Candidatus Methanobinarius endosymbioticus]|uniref:Right handed beta helix domain-containing protein n=1 Tax=Candidatus Methanobinarius endosymbioticus TaxID=2006182 RepID=A0A366MD77_9EURY|nr:hypothetical protein ALNOE001_10500 [Candidatus Methanobinarius endosymbioticus]
MKKSINKNNSIKINFIINSLIILILSLISLSAVSAANHNLVRGLSLKDTIDGGTGNINIKLINGEYNNLNDHYIVISNVKNVTITETSVKNMTITLAGDGRLFQINNGGRLTIINTTLKNYITPGTGSRHGGVIYNEDVVRVTNCDFVNNTSPTFGGVIYTEGDVRLTNCNFLNNTANFYGGVIYTGISAKLTGDNCTFKDTEQIEIAVQSKLKVLQL